MTNEHEKCAKEDLKYLPQKVDPKCQDCEGLLEKIELYTDAAQKQYSSLVDILAEHKVLLNRIVTLNASETKLVDIFPINTEEKLKQFNTLLATEPDPYKWQIKSLLAGNAERNLHKVFGRNIIMNFNVDGSFGKKRLRDFENVFTAIIDVISAFSESSYKTLRAALHRQKKKYFKQTSRSKTKNNDEAKSINEVDASV